MDWRAIGFDWNKAKAFLVTAEEGSLSAAARALNTSQPTLGRQVAALEQELGVSLFERTARGYVLTNNGLELLEHVKRMAIAATSFSMTASGRAEEIEGDICVSATEITAAYLLPPILAKLKKIAPGINIEIKPTNETSDLLKREADIAIRAFRPTQSDLIIKKLRTEVAHPYASKTYLDQFPKPRRVEHLKNAHFINFNHSDMMCKYLNRMGYDLTPANFPFVVNNHLVQWQMVKQGVGIGFITENIGDNEPLVEKVLPDKEGVEIELWLVVHRELKTSRRLRLVFDFLAQELTVP